MFDQILNTFLGGFTNYKTTLTSIVAALVYLLHSFHVVDITNTQAAVVTAFFVLVYGWISKDTTVTGTPADDGN